MQLQLNALINLIMDFVEVSNETAEDWAVYLLENFDLNSMKTSEIEVLIFDEFIQGPLSEVL